MKPRNMIDLKNRPEEEKWLPVVGYEGSYEVSNFANVRSVDRTTRRGRNLVGRPMKVWSKPNRYAKVALSKGDTEKCYGAHRLVAEAFIPNPLNKRTVNHIDGNKHNNHVSNLEWATMSENQIHAVRAGLAKAPDLPFGENHPTAKLTNVDVEMIRVLVKEDFTLDQIAKRFKVHPVHISAIKLGKTRMYDQLSTGMTGEELEINLTTPVPTP